MKVLVFRSKSPSFLLHIDQQEEHEVETFSRFHEEFETLRE